MNQRLSTRPTRRPASLVRAPAPEAKAGTVISAPRTRATALRVITQLRHDPRTVAMILTAPCGLLSLLKGVFWSQPQVFQNAGGALAGVFPCLSLFLASSIVIQRERGSGTLERLLAMPTGKCDLIIGYTLGFAVVAAVQAAVITTLAVHVLGLDLTGPISLLWLTAMSSALFGIAVGLLVSAFTVGEFQALQCLPTLLLPQFMLSGILMPRESLPAGLEQLSYLLPLTHAVDAATYVRLHPHVTEAFVHDTAIVLGSTALILTAGAATLRRQTF
ncbi:ABC transporter permease [Streptomyces sp. NRRL S-237]|uniref:ABC transporter permease n=1 Tax=Streptomyces sp. NRRL S-237 TaxID=1463895 RepID=UPI001F2509E3|nr:ABC transporter permease [Streptomyces sp. NRRL S-237]